MCRLKIFLLLSFLTFGITNCSSPLPDFTEVQLRASDDLVKAPDAHYREPVWLDDTHLAFSYRKSAFGDSLGDYRIAYTSLNSDFWQDITPPPVPEECSPVAGLVKNLHRLPNGNLGFTYSCYADGISGIVYTWDKAHDTIGEVYSYPVPFAVGPFSYSPDMSEYLQVGENGLSQELYRVKLGQEIEVVRIFPEFKRVNEPMWSSDGKTIAFIGNETVDESSTWQSLLLLPWDLYLMDADGSNVQLLFSQIGNPYNMRWSPDGQWLFFSGSRRLAGAEGGIWMLNVETLGIYRIWPENAFFDLSLDGEKIVIMVIEREDNEIERIYPVIHHLPES